MSCAYVTFHLQTKCTFVIEWHTRFVTVIHSVALSGHLNFHVCLLLLLLFVVVKKCSTFKLTKRLITILVRCHFCGFAFPWNLICVSHCYGFTLSWITKLEESSLCTNAPFPKKKWEERLSPRLLLLLFFFPFFFWREGNALIKCKNEKWKLKKILIVLKNSQKIERQICPGEEEVWRSTFDLRKKRFKRVFNVTYNRNEKTVIFCGRYFRVINFIVVSIVATRFRSVLLV